MLYPLANSLLFADSLPIKTYDVDITGDGLNEVIELKGMLFSEDSKYYQDVWANITNEHSEQWRIPYEGGYQPHIEFIDLNHDNTQDLLYQSSTGGSGGLYHYHLHTLKNEKIIEIPLPKQLYIKGGFIDNFSVEIQISPNSEQITMNVEDNAEDYIRLDIYNQQGKLLKPTQIMIDPIAYFDPILISKSKGYGLKSYQQINGAYRADQLGTIETLWYYENDDWIILQTKWITS